MSYLPREGWARVAVVFMYAVIAYLACKFLLPLFRPFIAAYLIALLLRPVVRLVSRAVGIPRRAAAVVLLVLLAVTAGFGLWNAGRRVAGEIVGIGEHIGEFGENVSDKLRDGLRYIAEKTGSGEVGRLAETGDGVMRRLSGEVTSLIASSLTDALPKAVTAVPDGLFSVGITAIAACYMTAGFDRLNERLLGLMPPQLSLGIRGIVMRLKKAASGYFRAALTLMAITFALLFVGFLVIRIDYAFTAALLCALADLLPVIGVGMILLPWSLVSLVSGDYFTAAGLAVLWGVIAAVRQFIEPKIVSKSVGLDPLLTLAAMYVGWKLGGFVGMIVGVGAGAVLFPLARK